MPENITNHVNVDVVVVGGGVSGLYTAWRLLTGFPQRRGKQIKVLVLERSHRIGGRLLTWRPFPDNTELHAELGGMRFFLQQKLLWALIHYFVAKGKLQKPIKFYVNDPNHNNLWYLRQHILLAPDLVDPAKVPYMLDAASRYADPDSIVAGVIEYLLATNRRTITRRLKDNKTQPGNWEEWDLVKPYLRYNGRKLWDIGFWNLLSDLLSPEGYNYATDGFGYSSVTNNWNAAEAIQSVHLDFTQKPDYQTLREGYDYLPALLCKEVKAAGGEVLLKQAVTKIDRASDRGLVVSVREGQTVRAQHVVLAMPRRSLELLDETSLWNWDEVVARQSGRQIRLIDYIQSVIPYPAFKLFLAYKKPWWREPPTSIAAGRSTSDLPLRQTYYFPPVPDAFPPPQPGSPLLNGPGLVMASYDDLGAVSFWRALEVPEERKDQVRQGMRGALAAHPGDVTSTSDHSKHVAEINHALENERGFYFAPAEMVRHAQQQLRYVHRNQVLPDPMPNPQGKPGELLAAYKDWGHDPYGGGWNFWRPGVNVKLMMEGIRRPFHDVNLYVVGEAYSGNQGWVEGALTTAEKVLRELFHLPPAPWQPTNVYLGY